jgi:diguanylate cyclase (GGDEF)-like protein/PAS domain S-box-containing protein
VSEPGPDGRITGIAIVSKEITERKQAEDAKKESEERYRTLVENASDIVFRTDNVGHFTFVNPAALRITGYKEDETLGIHYPTLIRPDMREEAMKFFGRQFVKRIQNTYLEYPILTKEGHEVWLGQNTQLLVEDGHITGFQAVARDITERKRTEEALRESEKKLSSIIHGFSIPTFVIGKDHKVLHWNAALERLSKIPAAEVVGTNEHWRAFYAQERPCMADLLVDEVIDKIPHWYEGKYIKSSLIDGAYEATDFFPTLGEKGDWLRFTAAAVRDLHGNLVGAVETLEDITDHKQAEEKIQQMAYHDSLTGLPNRKLFSDRLGIALAQAQRNQKGVAITMLDLDHFKDVNDTLGHDVGDLLLKAAAERLRATLRKGDTVARFGGDEFVLILPDLKGIEDVIQVAQKIVNSFRKPFLIDTHQLIVTTSIGIAVYPHDGTDEGILLKNADKAMYQVKQTGRDRYQLCNKA